MRKGNEKICTRCGKHYKENKYNDEHISIIGIEFLRAEPWVSVDDNRDDQWSQEGDDFDLCDECQEELRKFLNLKENN